METAPLKNFATWARTALIREVTARIAAVLAPGSSERVEQAKAVAALEKAVTAAGGGDKGRAAVADKVAYTWFNRIIALRFMDANGYTGIGVVSPQAGVEVGQPEILAEAKRGVIDTEVASQATRTAVAGLLDGTRASGDPQGEAYALLLADYCRYWNRAMPFMFEREGDFTELLIPANLLADDSVLNRSVKVLTEDVCKDVEVIGWLYQFYISERKDEVFAGFKKNKKAGADEIPAATQLFTPHWIVRYLVENSLGRLWMLNRPIVWPGQPDGLLHRPGRRGDRLPQDHQARRAEGHRPGLRLGPHAHLRLRPALRDLRGGGLRPGRDSRPDPHPQPLRHRDRPARRCARGVRAHDEGPRQAAHLLQQAGRAEHLRHRPDLVRPRRTRLPRHRGRRQARARKRSGTSSPRRTRSGR